MLITFVYYFVWFFFFKSIENRTPLHFEITRTIERKVIEIAHQRPILEKNSD